MAKKDNPLPPKALDKVTGGYLNYPQDAEGNYICPSCGGAINQSSLVCSGCGKFYGKSSPTEQRRYE